jgi:uncharacterized membrane protein YeiB
LSGSSQFSSRHAPLDVLRDQPVDALRDQPVDALRDQPVDALRVWALFGVFVVNWVGYLYGPAGSSPLGPALPADSALSFAIMWLLMTLVQSKAYPLMAFAVGYGLQAAWQRDCARALASHDAQAAKATATAKRRARDGRMALLGVLHGVLLYSGDILLLYAMVGWVAVRYAGLRDRVLRRKWRKWMLIWLALNMFIFLMMAVLSLSDGDSALPTEPKFLDVAGDLWAWWLINFKSWFSSTTWSNWFLLPQFVVFAVFGMWAARWRLCGLPSGIDSTQSRFAQHFWSGNVHRIAGRGSLVAALVFNALVSWFWLQDLGGSTPIGLWSSACWYLASAWLAFAYLCAFMRWVRQPAPPQLGRSLLSHWALAARMSLSAYLALSALLVFSLHTGFLRFEHTAARAATALLLWLLAMWIAQRVSAHLHARGRKPWLEGWISSGR